MNNFNKKHREKHLAFFDINIFAREGFTSGALIYVKEILLRLNRWGIPAEVLSIGHAQLSSRIKSKNKIDKYIDINEGIPVKEWVIKQSFHENPHLYIESIEKIFKNYNRMRKVQDKSIVDKHYYTPVHNSGEKVRN